MPHQKTGESHRIYWQQWLSAGTSNSGERASRRELVTSSAAVRISKTGARARDVTDLLRDTLHLSTAHDDDGERQGDRDCLVLVGTLYSLPRDYVQFEHEVMRRRQREQMAIEKDIHSGDDATTTSIPVVVPPSVYTAQNRADPFHVVHTLLPEENPLTVRDRMTARLGQIMQSACNADQRTIISPKLQWYFVPAADKSSSSHQIPNCIELDGYCTGMEDEDDEDSYDDDDSSSVNNDETDITQDREDDETLLLSRFPWLATTMQSSTKLSGDLDERERMIRVKLEKEEHRFQQLSVSQSALQHHCLSGYLLKRSRRDPQVWRRVHCVLTDDYLWFVSRIYTTSNQLRYAKHCRIRLTRTLLLEAVRTPFAFEVVSASGTSHVFRAPTKKIQLEWVQSLSDRIVLSYENSFMDNPELIQADECMARNRRRTALSVEPLWDACVVEGGDSMVTDPAGGHYVMTVLRWGTEVAKFRECCRYIQSILPAKSVVVVATTSHRPSSPQAPANVSGVAPDPVESDILNMIRATWEEAAALLARGTHIALTLQQNKLSPSIETACRHIDYVITGRFRPLHVGNDTTAPMNGGDKDHHHQEPPPIELFDLLLADLQTLAAAADQTAKENVAKENGDNIS